MQNAEARLEVLEEDVTRGAHRHSHAPVQLLLLLPRTTQKAPAVHSVILLTGSCGTCGGGVAGGLGHGREAEAEAGEISGSVPPLQLSKGCARGERGNSPIPSRMERRKLTKWSAVEWSVGVEWVKKRARVAD